MARRKYNLVYGGGNIGLMGAISETVKLNGGSVKGVIPRALAPKEISGTTVGDVIYVDDMHTRKTVMYSSSDAFIAMPGGIGTFEELFECMTWVQLGIHSKPIGVLNIDGYYDHLKGLLEDAGTKGFVDPTFVQSIIFSDDPIDLLNKIESTPPAKAAIKWISEKQS
eukprot:gene6101-7068_t